MNILIDIGHPAHVHFFRNLRNVLESHGHEVFIVARNKDISFELLKVYNIPFINLGKHYKTILGKICGGLGFVFKFANICLKNKIDIVLDSGGTVYPAIATSLIRIPNISFNNTDVFRALYFTKFFTSAFITPYRYNKDLGKKHIRVQSFNELAFLHPSFFKPNKEILKKLGCNNDCKYSLLRFVSWNAAEEMGSRGYSIEEIRNIVKEFSKYGKVFISCEYELPGDLSLLQIENNKKVKYGDMQDIEYYASLFYGESGAMAAESSILATPAFFISPKKLGFTEELEEKYQLVYNFTSKKKAFASAIEFLKGVNRKKEWQEKRKKMLSEKINYTAFMVWFVENYPESFKIMKENPNFQYRFK